MKHLFTILLVGLFIVAPFRMEGVIAYPYPVEYQQPNGEVIVLRMHGKNIFIAFIDKSTIESQMWLTNFEIKADYPDGIDAVAKVTLPMVYVQDRTAYFKNVSGAAEAEIFDATGKLHYRISVSDGMSQYIAEPGIYIVKLKNGNQTYNYKLIVR